MTKDYYKILDIPTSSTQDDIKSAYRKLARKWHPDIAGNTPDIIARFKEINEAYEILSNFDKKNSYDKARKFYNYSSTHNTNKTYQHNKTTNPNPSYKSTYTSKKEENSKKTFWEEFFSSKRDNSKVAKNGENIYSDIEITLSESINGAVKIINMLQTEVCPKCNGRRFINGSVCPCCKGNGESSTYKRFSVKIPAGIKNHSKIRLAGEGERGINGGNNGDLYLTVHIKEPKDYTIEGLNIFKTVNITPYEAVLGGNITISTLLGKVSLKIAPNTKNGQKIRLSGCGIEQKDKIGDMIVTVEIQIPQNLTEEEISLYKKLRELGGEKRVF